MVQQVKAYGQILQFPDGMSEDDMANAIRANEADLNPDYKAPEPEALDYTKGFASGANKLVAGVGYLAEAAGAKDTGKAIREFGDRGAAYWNERMSPGGKKAAESQVFVDDPESITGLRLGDDAGKALLMGAAQSLPSMFAAALPGVAITKGIQALASLGLAGGAGATIPLLAGTAAPVGVASQVIARAPAAVGFGAAEGIVAGGMNAAGLKTSIEGMSDKELLKSPVYQALRAQHGEEKSRSMLADQAASDLFGKTAVSTGTIGALTGGGALGSAYQKVTSGAADGILMTGLKGAGQEAIQETPQSGGEKYIENITRKEYLDPSIDPMSGVIAEAASGGAIGAFTGGIVGAGSAINITKQKITPIADASTVDDAIVAAHEAIRTEDPTLDDLKGAQKNETQATIDAGQAQAAEVLDIVLPDNTSVKAQWKIVDADQLAASMKEDVNQPRDRTRAASDIQIKSIANAPDYRRLSDSPVMDVGAPVVDQDGRIVAGNGRFAGLSQAYEQGTATEYMNQLREDAARKGLSIEGIAKPVLVRQLSEPVDTRKMAIASNSGTTLQMSALEQANLDAERMKGIENLDVNDLGDIALTPRNLTQLKDSLGSYTSTELGSLVDKGGQLSQEGVKRVRNAMLAKAYGSSPTLEKLVESTDSDMRNVLGALTKSASHIIGTKGDTKALLEAVDTYSQLKATGQPVDNFLAQQDAFSDGLSKEAEGILRFIDTNVRSQKKLTDFFKDNFVEVDTTSADMFADKLPNSYIDESKRHPNAKAASKNASWVIKNKATGEVLFETFDKAKVDALNTSKYEAVPIYEHLTGLNKDERITSLEKHLKDNGYDFRVEPASVRDIDALDSTKKARKELAEKQAKLFKKKVVFVKADGPFRINGVMVPSIADTIFVDIRTDKAFDAIMAHELSHWMEQEKPAVYKELVKSLKKVIVEDATEGYAKQYEIEGATKADITKEIVGDLMGDNFTEQSFWQKVAEANPKAFKDIAAAIIKWLKGVIVKAKANGMGSEQWVKDATKAQDIIAKAVAQYTESEVAPATKDGGVKFNVTGDNKSDIDKARVILNRLSDLYTRMMDQINSKSKDRELFMEFGERAVEAKDILSSMLESGRLNGIGIEGKSLLSRNTSSKNPWRITFFSPVDGEPGGHNEYKSAKEALNESNLIVRSKDKDKIALFSRAYHGSPHDHNKFDSSKIGTGEGAQAYGYGHYFAESKDVAEYYKSNLEKTLYVDGKPLLSTNLSNTAKSLGKFIALGTKSFEDIKSDISRRAETTEAWLVKHKDIAAARVKFDKAKSELDAIHEFDGKLLEIKPPEGKLYEVELSPEQDEYLLWDEPLSEQSDKVKAALGELNDKYGYAYGEVTGDKFYKALTDDINADGLMGDRREFQQATSELLHSLGIRGIKYLDGSSRAKGEGAYNYVIFDDKDVSITAKFSKAAVENTLIAQHNLTAKNLIHVDRMGGLAAPSIAIADKKHPLHGFGEITLLSSKDLVDPKQGAKAYGSDIYSPRYPSISYDFSGKAIKNLNAILADGVEKTGDREFYNDSLENDPFRELTHSSAAMYQFLKESGKEPELAYTKVKELPTDSLKPFADGTLDSFDMSKDEGFIKLVKDYWAEKFDGEILGNDELSNLARAYSHDVIAYRDSKKNVGKVDRQATNSLLFRQITDSGLRNKFDEYLVDVVNLAGPKERIFQGYTYSGNRRYIAHDIDNVIKILKKDLRGGENFKYGLGSIRAKYSPQFKSIEQIKKSKDRLMDSDSFDLVKKEIQSELNELDSSLSPYGTFSGYDNVETMLSDTAKMGVSKALTENGFKDVPDSIKLDIGKFLVKLKDMPTEYFEVKLLRSVGLGEFTAAIIPDDSTQQVRDILKRNGIDDIREYKAGDNADRVAKIGTVDRVMFSRAPKLYSKLEQALEAASDKIFSTGPQVKLWLQSNAGKMGVKKDEIYWSGIDNWLDAQGKVSKQQVVEFVRNNGVKVEDKTLRTSPENFRSRLRERTFYEQDTDGKWYVYGDKANDTDVYDTEAEAASKVAEYNKGTSDGITKHNNDKLTLPGGTDYKELVVTVPTIEPHNADDTTHFGDTGGGRQIGWLRMDTRDGGLFIEELQSQRAQQGRSKGFGRKPLTLGDIVVKKEDVTYKFDPRDEPGWSWAAYDKEGNRITSFPHSYSEERAKRSALSYINSDPTAMKAGVPPAPFVSDANNKATNAYITLLMKKALIEAVSNDHASVSWTTGDQQADRYDLSKQISEVKYSSNYLKAYNLDGDLVLNEKNVPENKLQDYIGKDAAEKLIAQPKEGPGKMQHLSGVDLKVGGEWAQSMYGNEQGLNLQSKPSLISQAANDIFKHVGSGKVESINGQPGFYVTPEMKSKDLPLFSRADTVMVDGVERPTTNSEGKQINNPVNFWKWFGNSEARQWPSSSRGDRSMAPPLVFYHGTKGDFNEFVVGSPGTNSTVFGPWETKRAGMFFTQDKKFAESFATQGDSTQGANIIPVYLKVENAIDLTEGFTDDAIIDALAEKGVNPRLMYNISADQIWGMFDEEDDGSFFVSKLKELGYDGAIIVEPNTATEDSVESWVVFSPNQIKSTIGNNGDYSRANNDIRFSKEPSKPTPPDETRLRRFQRMNQDSFNRFTVFKEWLAENGQTLSDKADVYGAEERYHSKAANQLEDFREQQRNPLIEKIQKAGYTLGDIEVFLKMQHAQEANSQIRKLGGDTAYGITDDEAADYLTEAPENLAKLANELRDITEQTKKLRLDEGILNTDITDAWESTYKHYMPAKGDADSTRGVGKGLKTNFKSKRRLGHSLRDEHVIENILMDHERAILEVERNRVGKHLVMMAAEMQRPDILSIGQPEKRKVLKTDTAYTVEANGVVQGVFKSREEAKMFKQFYAASMPKVAPSAIVINQTKDQRVIASASPMLAENEVNVYMNGHAIRVQIKDEPLARAYTKMGVEQFSDIVAAGRILNGYLSKVYTGYNPEFILTNMIRDFSSGTINLTGEQGFGMATKALTNYPRMFTDLLKYAATNGKSSTKWIDSYRANGGNTGAAYLSDMERLGNEVSTEYASHQGVISNLKQGDNANAARAAGRKVFNATLKWIYNLNQAGENAMRLAAFKAMLDSGRTVNEAAKVAKNITVNFNRKGERQWAPALYLFYNASVQGTAATGHALFKGKHKGQAWALAGSMAAVGYMVAAAFGGGTEDDWDEINDYTKERNMLIKSGDGYVKVPVPYGYGFFWNLGRYMSEAQRTGDWGKMPWHLATSAMSELTPFNDVVVGSDEEFRSDQVFMGLLPTAMKIVAQPTFNKQLFTGSELMPDSPFDKSQPDREKMFRSTKGTMYDTVAGWLDSAGIDISPETLKYTTRTFTGGAGSLVDTGISAAMLKAEGAELDTQEIPFVRKGYMELGIKDKRAAYYKVREEARTAAEEFNRARRANDTAKMQTVLKDKNELIALDRFANKLAATIDAARDQQDAVRADKNLSVQEKRLKLKDMEATEAKFYDQYLDVFKAKLKR